MSGAFPLPTYNYRVRIGSLTIAFSEVSGLSVQHEEIVYRHGLSESKGFILQRGFTKPVNISLKKGILIGPNQPGMTRTLLQETFLSGEKLDFEIELCEESGTPLVTWKVIGALSLKYEMPALQASSNEVAVESLDLVARKLLFNDQSYAV